MKPTTFARRGILARAALAAVTVLFFAAAPIHAMTIQLNGAGATFPYPLYAKWFDVYRSVDNSVQINYASIGSGGGIRQITNKTVDFGASDAPLTDEELAAVKGELFHIPTVVGAVAVVYNVTGVRSGLKLTPDVLADIYLGKIKRWNEKRIADPNPGVRLPNLAIAVARRSDGSGTTHVFSDYLSNVSKAWAEKVGTGKSLNWPVGLGGKGNEGVAGLVEQIPGAIGYVELAYAEQNDLAVAELRNKAGRFVAPTIAAASAAAAGVRLPADFRISIVNADGLDAYPITAFTYLLAYKEQVNAERAQKLARFLWWAIHDGQKYAGELGYAPLPAAAVKLVEAKLKQLTASGRPLLS